MKKCEILDKSLNTAILLSFRVSLGIQYKGRNRIYEEFQLNALKIQVETNFLGNL